MISLFKVNERIGDSFRPVRGPKRANRRILWLKKVEKFLFCPGRGGRGVGTQRSFVRRGIAKNNKTRPFPRLFHKHRMHLLALFSLFTHGYDRFPYQFYILQQVKSLPFHIPEACKRYPVLAVPEL